MANKFTLSFLVSLLLFECRTNIHYAAQEIVAKNAQQIQMIQTMIWNEHEFKRFVMQTLLAKTWKIEKKKKKILSKSKISAEEKRISVARKLHISSYTKTFICNAIPILYSTSIDIAYFYFFRSSYFFFVRLPFLI